MIPAVDLHTHLNHNVRHDTIVNELYRSDIPFLLNRYDTTHIACGVFSTFSSVLSAEDVTDENEYLFRLAQENNRVYQWVVINPRDKRTFEQADRMLSSEKTLGIKIHPGCHGYDILQYADELFSFANERKRFLLMHPEKIPEMVPFADKYPNMNLIIAHLGSVEHVDAIQNAANGNIFTDTSGNASSQNNVLEYTVSRVGADRIFFGTDTYSCEFQRGRIEFSPISSEDRQKILALNALRCFPVLRKNPALSNLF